MTDSRPEITVRSEPPFVVVHLETAVGIPAVKDIPLSIDEAQQLLSDLWAKCNVVATILDAQLKVVEEVCGKKERRDSDWVGKVFEANCKAIVANVPKLIEAMQSKQETWRDRERLL